MESQYVTIPAGAATPDPAHHGGAEPAPGTCGLTCPTRPRFFWGQLLNDQDLTAMLDWAGSRLSLGRYRQGWGIVCGLEVAADARAARKYPQRHTSRVTIQPGYAVSCCGEDLVLSAEETIDLAGVFDGAGHGCDSPRPPAKGEQKTWAIGGLNVPQEQVRVADLFLHYRELLSSRVPALARGQRSPNGACDYSRAREAAEIKWHCESDPTLPAASHDDIQAWETWLREASRLIDAFERIPPTQLSEVTTWLRGQLDERSRLAQGAAEMRVRVKERIAGREAEYDETRPETYDERELRFDELPANAIPLLFWIIQERRNAQLMRHACGACSGGAGVPLARVWLRATYDEHRKRTVDVLHVDSSPRHRRLLEEGRWPALAGKVNLAQCIWRRPEEVYPRLADFGIRAIQIDWAITTLDSLKAGLGATVFANYGDELDMYVLDGGPLGLRVTGFASHPAPPSA